MGKLGKDTSSLRMNRICQLPVTGDDAVVEIRQAMLLDHSGWVDRCGTRELEPRAISCEGPMVGDVVVAWHTVFR